MKNTLHFRFLTQGSIALLLYLLITVCLSSCAATYIPNDKKKINGVSLESPSNPTDERLMIELEELGANTVCLVPYSYIPKDSTRVLFDLEEWQWWGERSDGIRALVTHASEQNLEVMIKPHLWLGWGDYTGDLSFSSATEQKQFNESYSKYILHYAQLAEELGVSHLCIGTELCSQVAENPDYWRTLIHDVRSLFYGQVTYAANWDCYQDFPLWDELDFIGIDGYFPIAQDSTSHIDSIKAAWNPWLEQLSTYSKENNRPILFTEYGYRSVDFALMQPWEMSKKGNVDYEKQKLGYQALYESLWHEEWFAGGFLWKWHCKEHLDKRTRNQDFTPQNKPVIEVIKKTYKSYSLKNEE